MKPVLWAVPLLALPLLGCNDASQPGQRSAASGEGAAASAPADYLNAAAQAQHKAVKTIDLAAINKAIENFYVQEGRFPKNLEELEDKGYLRALPLPPEGMKLNYDTNSGVVALEKDLGKQ